MENVKMVTGVVLVDAPASALNNAGIERGRMAENKVIVKKIRYKGEQYPYVSGQAFKRWWRETIYEKFGWPISQITREEKVAYTEGNPIKYEEDDIFGYMLAPKTKIEEISFVSGLVYRRIAPLKCTPLISLFGNVTTDDFGTFTRGKDAEAEPVPYEQEFYTTVLKGTFSLMLNEIGVFSRGRSKDLPGEIDTDEALKGKRIDEKTKKQVEKFNERTKGILSEAKNKEATITEQNIALPEKERKKRIKETLLALSELSGGAKVANYLTDVAPKFIATAIITCANHIFMDIIKTKDNKPTLDTSVLEEIVRDYGDKFLSPIYIGLRKGFLEDAEYDKISKISEIQFDSDDNTKKIQVVFGTPKEAINKLVEDIEKTKL